MFSRDLNKGDKMVGICGYLWGVGPVLFLETLLLHMIPVAEVEFFKCLTIIVFLSPPCLLFHFCLRECEGSDWFPRSFTFGKGMISIRLTNLLILH